MTTNTPMNERRPGEQVPRHQRVIAALVVAVCCAWLNVFPQFNSSHNRWLPNATYALRHTSEHGWPLVALRIARTTLQFDEYGLQRPAPLQIGIESWNLGAAAYNLVVALALLVLASRFYLPWDAYPEPKFSLIELLVFLTSVAVGLAFVTSQFAAHAAVGEILPLAAIWIVGTGIVNGILAHLAWRRRCKLALADMGASK